MATYDHQTLLPGWHVPVNPALVKAIGYLEAYVLSQIWYWEQNPQSTGWTDENGISWVYNSARAWAEQLGLTQSQARHVLDKLRKQKLVLTQKLQAKRWVQDLHYRVNFDRVLELVSAQQHAQETQHSRSIKSRKVKQDIELPTFAKSSKSMKQNSQIDAQISSNDLTNTSTKTSSKTTTDVAAFSLTPLQEDLMRQLQDKKVFVGPTQKAKCFELIQEFGEERIQRQLNYEQDRPKAKNPAARLVAAIQHDYAAPHSAQSEAPAPDKTEQKNAIRSFLEQAQSALRLMLQHSGEVFDILAVSRDGAGGLRLRNAEGQTVLVPVSQLLGKVQLVMA